MSDRHSHVCDAQAPCLRIGDDRSERVLVVIRPVGPGFPSPGGAGTVTLRTRLGSRRLLDLLSGEHYAIPGRNALVMQTASPEEFVRLFTRLRQHADDEASLRRAGRRTAEQFAWPEVVTRNLLPAIAIGG